MPVPEIEIDVVAVIPLIIEVRIFVDVAKESELVIVEINGVVVLCAAVILPNASTVNTGTVVDDPYVPAVTDVVASASVTLPPITRPTPFDTVSCPDVPNTSESVVVPVPPFPIGSTPVT